MPLYRSTEHVVISHRHGNPQSDHYACSSSLTTASKDPVQKATGNLRELDGPNQSSVYTGPRLPGFWELVKILPRECVLFFFSCRILLFHLQPKSEGLIGHAVFGQKCSTVLPSSIHRHTTTLHRPCRFCLRRRTRNSLFKPPRGGACMFDKRYKHSFDGVPTSLVLNDDK